VTTKARIELEKERQSERAWAEETLGRLRDVMVGEVAEGQEPEIGAERRVKILAVMEDLLNEHAEVEARRVWKLSVQTRFLKIVAVIMLAFIMFGVYRYNHITAFATARAWKMFNQRQIIAAKTGEKAGKMAMIWVGERLKEIDLDNDTPEGRRIRKDNVIAFGNKIVTQIQIAKETADRLSNTDMPDRIDRFTYIRDPFTGRSLVLNATPDGSISNEAIEAYLKQDNLLVRLVAAAKAYSQPGAEPLPPILFDESPQADREKLPVLAPAVKRRP